METREHMASVPRGMRHMTDRMIEAARALLVTGCALSLILA